MKFNNTGPTVVPKPKGNTRPLPNKRDMTKVASRAEPMDEAAMEAIQRATGGRVPPPRDEPVNMASLMGNTASIKQKTPLGEIRAREASGLGPEWTRQDLPSKGVPYDFMEVFLRPLSATGLSKISASVKNNSYPMLVDALDTCINVDIRSLTPEDFNFVMFWVRLNSYPAKPMQIPWTSKYGNENKHIIKTTQLDIIEIEMTREEFDNDWKPRGICFPTVRDMEIQAVDKKTIPEEDVWRVELSQYIDSGKPFNPQTYIQDKLDRLEELVAERGLDIQGDIKEFISRTSHGVREKVMLTDQHFTPAGAVAHWTKLANDLQDVLKSAMEQDMSQNEEIAILGISDRILEYREMALNMQKQIDDGVSIKPEQEVITIGINVMDFFPYV